jgi:molybdopterin converting factor small subunit
MEINVLAFGKIADIAAARAWKMEGVNSTADVRRQLEEIYPGMRGLNYLVAVNKEIVTVDTPLHEGAEVALMPPFSGG